MKVFRHILLDNHYDTTDQKLKLLRTQLELISLKTEQQELKVK